MIKNKKVLYFIVPLLVIVFLLPLFKMEYATDTYALENDGFYSIGEHMLNNNARPVTALFLYLFGALSLSVTSFYYFSLLLAIVFSSVAIIRLYFLLQKNMSPICAIFLSVFTVLIPVSAEYFLFIEKGFFLFAICMAIIGCEGFVLFLNGKRYGLFIAFPSILLSSLTYQVIPGAFAVLSTLFSILFSNNLKKLVKNLSFAILIYGFGSITNLLLLKLFTTSSRVGSGIDLGYVFDVVFFLGAKTVLLYIAIIAVLLLVCLIINKVRNNKLFSIELRRDFFNCFLILLAGFTVTVVPCFFAEVWFTFRTIYPLSVVIPAIVIYFCFNKKPLPEGNTCKGIKRLSIIVMAVVLCLCLVFFYILFIGRHINNARDNELVEKINEEILCYENESNVKIKYIKIYYDKSVTVVNGGVLRIGDCNVRAFSKEWSDVSHMNVILGKNYIKQKADTEIYKKYFANKDWNEFSSEQLVFDGETLHICVY